MDYDLKESRNCCDNCCVCHPTCHSTGCVGAAALAAAAIYFCSGALFCTIAAFARPSLPLLALGVACWLMCALAALYHRGARAGRDAPMIPLLVAELLLRLAFGWTVAGLWIGAVLVNYNQLDEWLPAWIGAPYVTPSALLTAAATATVALALHMRVYFFFYGGYRRVKKANDRRRMDADDGESAAAYARLSPNRARPTVL